LINFSLLKKLIKERKKMRKVRNLALSVSALSMLTAAPLLGTLPTFAAHHHSSPESVKFSAKTASPIKHTIVIFQENRSFDNYFGTYPYAPGFKPLNGTPKDVRNFKYVAGNVTKDANGNVYNPAQDGTKVYPWHDTGKAAIQETDVNHGYNPMIDMVDGGKMDKFYQVNHDSGKSTDTNDKGKLAMSYFDYNDIPAYWQYAQHFALADNYFQPVYGPSTPGALYMIAAQSGNGSEPASNTNPKGQITGDPNPKNGPFGGDNYPGLTYNLTYTNIGDELSAASQSWAWYQGGWDAAKVATNATKPVADKSTVSPDALKYSPHHNPFQYFQNYEDGKYNNNLKDYNKFSADIQNGNLPAVSFIKAGYGDDEHPGTGNQSTPSAEDFTVNTINEIMNSKYWKDTAIVVTYDEGGGFYDHVAPSAITPNADALQGNGPRVPMFVISPYAKENFVSHVQYDHSSILKFIETNYHLPSLNSKDAKSNNMTDMFDFIKPDFTPYMFNDGSMKPGTYWGKHVNVQINNALMGVSNPNEAPFINQKGEVMVPFADFNRSTNGLVLKDKNQQEQNGEFRNEEQNRKFNSEEKDGIWISPTKTKYVPLKPLVNELGWSMTTNGDTVTVTSK
jgi:phospholipase C